MVFVFFLISLDAFTNLRIGRVQQPNAKNVEDPRKLLDYCRAYQDENEAHHQGHDDAVQQHFLLVFSRNPKSGNDQHKYEQVVQGQ